MVNKIGGPWMLCQCFLISFPKLAIAMISISFEFDTKMKSATFRV